MVALTCKALAEIDLGIHLLMMWQNQNYGFTRMFLLPMARKTHLGGADNSLILSATNLQ